MSGDEAEVITKMQSCARSRRAVDAEGNALEFLTLLREIPAEYRCSWQITVGE